MKYRFEIDGLRAVAVLGVFFFHLALPAARGGWLGVDVFFVISGYLITRILLEEFHSNGTISISNFYLRRVRRIIPALLFCLIGSFFIALPISGSVFFSEYIESFLAALFSVSNIFFWQHAGYFSLDANFIPLLHTWTLGVEEQFYIIIPVLFFLTAFLSRRGRKLVWFIAFLSVVLSFLFCRYGGVLVSKDFLYYMIPSRMWELGVGVIVAFILRRYKQKILCKKLRNVLSLGCLCFLIYAFSEYGGGDFFAEQALFACVATAVLIIMMDKDTIAGKLLSSRVFRFVGKISYSFYLWHYVLIFLLNCLVFKYNITKNLYVYFATFFVTFILATLSWIYVETPYRRLKTWTACLTKLRVPIALCLLCFCVGWGLIDRDEQKVKLSLGEDGFVSYEDIARGFLPSFGPNGSPNIVVVGDSHAGAVFPAFQTLGEEYGVSGKFLSAGGTLPLPSLRLKERASDPPYAEAWLQYINREKPPHIVLIAAWLHYTSPRIVVLDKPVEYNLGILKERLRRVVTKFLSLNCEVWVVSDTPDFVKNPTIAVSLIGNDYFEDVAQQRKSFVADALQAIDSPRLHILDPWAYLAQDDKLYAAKDGFLLYRDTHHLTPTGSLELKDLFRPIFVKSVQ